MTTTTTDVNATAPSSSLASSATFRTFALVFAITAPAIYVIVEMGNWPLFTYHPGALSLSWFYAPSDAYRGPAMYWYGWIADTLIGSTICGWLATLLPERMTRKIPLSLAWIMPIVALPFLIYALKFYWRW